MASKVMALAGGQVLIVAAARRRLLIQARVRSTIQRRRGPEDTGCDSTGTAAGKLQPGSARLG